MRKLSLLILLFMGLARVSQAQRYFSATEEEFGKSRIQTKTFSWSTIRSTNFELNYYRGGEEQAKKAIQFLENEYRRITDVLGYTPFSAMKVFLYNSPRDLAQSNIGLHASTELNGGIMNAAKSRVQIAYTGQDESFQKELIARVSDLFLYDMLFGGSLKEVLQNSILLTLPDWFMKGIPAYLSADLKDPALKDQIVQMIRATESKKLNHLSESEATLIGLSIWWYIAERYGKDNISNILNLTRIIRTEQSSVSSTLGISFSRFLKEWKSYYLDGPATSDQPQVSKPATTVQPQVTRLQNLKPGEVDTDRYEFNPENIEKFLASSPKVKGPSVLSRRNEKSASIREEAKISAPKAFANALIPNDINTTFVNDPVRRLGMKNDLILNDLLENHIFHFSLFVSPIVRSHDVRATYENLTKKIDWKVGFERRSIALDQVDFRSHYLFRPLNVSLPENNTLFFNRRVLHHQSFAQVSYPFSPHLKAVGRTTISTVRDIDYGDLTKDILSTNLVGLTASLVYDKTSSRLVNFPEGTKAKIIFDRQYALNSPNQGFDRLLVDVRRYQKILPGVVLAGRVSFGRSQGDRPRYTFLGGTENWINRRSETNSGQNVGIPLDLRDLAFYDFAGSLRGFNFGKMYGHNHILGNIELRFSMADLLSRNAAVASSLRNLQLVLFDDFGAAWNGTRGPFSRQNSLNTEVIGGGSNPFRATVTNFKNPFLNGYGIGLRTTILGYFIRADYAWGMENKIVNRPILHLSLGHDF